MKSLVIIGGGFTGTTIAKSLEREMEVTLIDTKDYFEYTPGILRTIVEPEHLRKIQRKHNSYLKHARIIVGNVDNVDKKNVLVNGKKIVYNYLVVASGSDYEMPIKEQNVVIGSRASHLDKSFSELQEAKDVLIVGGGLVGIELAAEIATHYKDKKIKLIHSRDRLIQRNNEKTVKYVEKFLKRKGVEFIFNERIKKSEKKDFITESGKVVKADLAFLTVGIKPNYKFLEKHFSNALSDRRMIKVDGNLRIVGAKNIFAGGDIVDIDEEKTAQNAEHEGEVIVHNLRALVNGGKMEEYKPKKRMMVVSLGKYDGVIEFGNFVLGGKIAALVKWGVEKWIMMKY
jgi:apoptosis-inducing factor 2